VYIFTLKHTYKLEIRLFNILDKLGDKVIRYNKNIPF
jgi:hypothetical protein